MRFLVIDILILAPLSALTLLILPAQWWGPILP